MTNAFTPIFEAQRTIVEQNRAAIGETVAAQKAAIEALSGNVESQQALAEQGVELSRSATHAYLDALEESIPEDTVEFDFEELRAAADDGFESVSESQAEAWEALAEAVEEGNEAYGELADSYMETVDSSFDAFIQSHEQVEANFDSAAETIPVEGE